MFWALFRIAYKFNSSSWVFNLGSMNIGRSPSPPMNIRYVSGTKSLNPVNTIDGAAIASTGPRPGSILFYTVLFQRLFCIEFIRFAFVKRFGDPIMNSSSDATIFDATLQQDNIDFAHSILELCTLQHAGNYSCVASNANTSHSVYFQVTVIQGNV